VVEVVSGDTVVILEGSGDAEEDAEAGVGVGLGAGVERRITFSSVRVPRLGSQRHGHSHGHGGHGDKDKEGPSGSAAEPWAIESRDYVKSRLIGKRVTVSVEFEKSQGR
jgi:endonuclease YncB( thermonuclease family)